MVPITFGRSRFRKLLVYKHQILPLRKEKEIFKEFNSCFPHIRGALIKQSCSLPCLRAGTALLYLAYSFSFRTPPPPLQICIDNTADFVDPEQWMGSGCGSMYIPRETSDSYSERPSTSHSEVKGIKKIPANIYTWMVDDPLSFWVMRCNGDYNGVQ